MKMIGKQVVIIFMTLATVGCATVNSLPQEGGEQLNMAGRVSNYTNTRIYAYPYERVFEAAKIVLESWNFTIEKANPKDFAILASGQMQAFSSGAVIGLYFTKPSYDKTLVETIEQRKIATQIAIKWHSSIILDGIDRQLKLEDQRK